MTEDIGFKKNASDLPREFVGKNYSKLKIAEVHINTSIVMLFNDFNPISIHTVTSSAYQITRDLAKHKQSSVLSDLEIRILPDKLKEFYSHVNKYWSFIKHADKNLDELFTGFDTSVNDLSIFMSIMLYQDLGGIKTQEMQAFFVWFRVMYDGLFTNNEELENLIGMKRPSIVYQTRSDLLKLGKNILDQGKLEKK